MTVPFVNDAVAWITRAFDLDLSSANDTNAHVGVEGDDDLTSADEAVVSAAALEVLVTGSFWLVGGVMEEVRPDVCARTGAEREAEEAVVREYEKRHQMFGSTET